MKTLSRKSGAFLLAAALLLALFALPTRAYAVDNNKPDCSITFNLGSEADKYAELKKTDFQGTLYKIAEVDAQYNYTATGDFTGLNDLDGLKIADFKNFNSENIKTLTAAAAGMVTADTAAAATAEFNNGDGTATVKNLTTGMYLLTIGSVPTKAGVYEFSPVLIPVPVLDDNGGDNYNVTVTLKTDLSQVTELQIVKELTGYSTTQGTATFIFNVKAEVAGEIVYSNVYPMTFTGVGQQSITVKNLPVGAKVTVTEVYSGTTYEATAGTEQVIEQLATTTTEGTANTVTFTNGYTKKESQGTAVINTYGSNSNGKPTQPPVNQ